MFSFLSKAYWFIKTNLIYRIFFLHIGRLSYLARPNILVGTSRIYLGNNIRILPHCRLEVIGEQASLTIADDVSIGHNFHCISSGKMSIGSGTTISANVFISNVDHDFTCMTQSIMKNKLLQRETQVGENCFVGYGAVILPGTELGKSCYIGANSVVKGAFPDGCMIAGNPARIIKKYNFDSSRWEAV